MIPDIQFMQDSFRRFNAEIFGGELPVPAFLLSNGRSFQGKCIFTRRGNTVCNPKIRLSICFDLPLREWEDVMIHEMLHLRIALIPECKETPHGPTFMRMMREINSKFGRNLSVSYREPAASSSQSSSSSSQSSSASEGIADGPIRRHYICLGVTPGGRPVVFRAAASRMFKVWDVQERFPDIKSRIWIGSLDPRLERIPKALEPRFYFLPDVNEWKDILSSAFALYRRGSTIGPGTRATLTDWLKEYCPALLPD